MEKFINEYLYRKFLSFMESRDASRLADALTYSVGVDVTETADKENWNSNDIDIALSRILLDTFCGKDY